MSHKPIQVGQMTITFLKTRHETGGLLEMFELTLPPTGREVIPHVHRDKEVVALGMNGISTWTVDGEVIELHPGGRIVVPQGVPHSLTNLHEVTTRMIVMHTPGTMGPEFFQEIAQHFNEDEPDILAISEVMNRYGIIPTATKE